MLTALSTHQPYSFSADPGEATPHIASELRDTLDSRRDGRVFGREQLLVEGGSTRWHGRHARREGFAASPALSNTKGCRKHGDDHGIVSFTIIIKK